MTDGPTRRGANQTTTLSLVKTAGYRVLMVIVTVVVALAVTGKPDQALGGSPPAPRAPTPEAAPGSRRSAGYWNPLIGCACELSSSPA